jgi:hypothetical protein
VADNIRLDADTKSIERLAAQYRVAARQGLGQVMERGRQIIREEVQPISKRLVQGVGVPYITEQGDVLSGQISISARADKRSGGTATYVSLSGKTKEVSLRAQPQFDFARALDEGTGVFGPKGAVIFPRVAKALLVPEGSGSRSGLNGPFKPRGYLLINGVKYITVKWTRGMPGYHYSDKALARLGSVAQGIFDLATAKVMQQPEAK